MKSLIKSLNIIIPIFIFMTNNHASAQCTYDPGFTLIQGHVNTAAPAMAKPAKGAWYKDPLFNTCCVRLTDDPTEPIRVYGRPDYSRRQAFNIDNSKVLIGMDGQGFYHLYDANTLAYLYEFSNLTGPTNEIGGDAECQWSATSPDTLYFMDNYGGLVIYKVSITTKVVTYAADFTNVKGIRGYPGVKSLLSIFPTATNCWTKAEGSPSADGRYWGYMVDNSSTWTTIGFMVYDMQTDSIIGIKSFSGERPDHCSMSPSGRWFVVSGADSRAYPRDLSGDGNFILGSSEHSDMAFNDQMQDIYVYAHYGSYEPAISYGKVGARNLDTWEYFDIFELYGANEDSLGNSPGVHFSGRAFLKPGWLVYSTDGGGANWLNNRILAFEMKPNGRILNIACQFNNVGEYWTETHATVSRDFTHIVWASTWLVSNLEEDVEAGMCVLPSTSVPTTSVNESDIPASNFRLSQNYPNPFNPTTTIEYQIPLSSFSQKGDVFVSLKVYDMLGREVAVLVNEKKPAGAYHVTFDAHSLSSSVYFYRLNAGTFTETKKLLLLK